MSTRVGVQSPYASIRIKGLLIAWAVWFSASPLILARPSPAWLHPRQAGGLGLCVLRQSPSPSGHCGPRTHDSPTNAVTPASDCEPLARNLMQELLHSWGYRVFSARNGRKAMEIAEEHKGPIHLLVSDVTMPEMDGPELAEKLKTKRPRL